MYVYIYMQVWWVYFLKVFCFTDCSLILLLKVLSNILKKLHIYKFYNVYI